MKRLVATLVLVFPFAAFGADPSPDSAFYKNAAEGGLSEVELGNLAQKKSNNESVKDFGAMMVKDHTAANNKLEDVAASKNISLPTSASMGLLHNWVFLVSNIAMIITAIVGESIYISNRKRQGKQSLRAARPD
jgi:hypothetical protein